jgi:transcriptional regulator with XRE-family HTH domain
MLSQIVYEPSANKRIFRLGHIHECTGLKRCRVSPVVNGHTVPSIETVEKMARGLEIPVYQLFCDGEAPQKFQLCQRQGRVGQFW